MNPNISARSYLARRWFRKKLLADISIWLFLTLYVQWSLSLLQLDAFMQPGTAFFIGYAVIGIFFFWVHTFTVTPLVQKRQGGRVIGWLLYLYIGVVLCRLVLWLVLVDHDKAYEYVLKQFSVYPSDAEQAVWLKLHKHDSLIVLLVTSGLGLLTISFLSVFGILGMFPTSLIYSSYARVKGWPGWIRRLAGHIQPSAEKLLTTNLLVYVLNYIQSKLSFIRFNSSTPFSFTFLRSSIFAKVLIWGVLGFYIHWVYTLSDHFVTTFQSQLNRTFVGIHVFSGLLFFWIHTYSNIPSIRERQYLEALSRFGYLFSILALCRIFSWIILIDSSSVIQVMMTTAEKNKEPDQIALLKKIASGKSGSDLFSTIIGITIELIYSFIDATGLVLLSIGYGTWVKIKGWPGWINARLGRLQTATSWTLVGWVIWLLLHFMIGSTGERISVLSILYYVPTLLIPTVVIFYFNAGTTFRLLDRNKPIPALFWTILLWLFLGIVKVVLFNTAQTHFGMPGLMSRGIFDSAVEITSRTDKQVFFNIDLDRLRTIFWREDAFLLLLSFVLGFSRRATKYRRDSVRLAEEKQQELVRQKELENELLKNQLELSESRLKMLQYQINPHFLFNTLNFLYAKALTVSDPLADALMKLSETMRYSLKNVGPQTQFQLDEEVRHLRNYIQLNQLRFSEQLEIRFEVEGKITGHTILPLLLVTFVENAFKYGDLRDPAHPVHIRLNVKEDHLTFWIRNKKRTGSQEESTGIGLDNTQQRLQSAYPNQHRLTINNEPAFFTVQVEIYSQMLAA